MEELEFIKKVVVAAYKKQIKGKKFAAQDKQNKLYDDVVTECDINTEKYILSCIKKKYPNDNFVSEEFNSDATCKGRCWILDPIDGTVNFKNGVPIWCIQIAFVVDGKTVFAVVYVPTANKLLWADETGFYVNGKLCKPNLDCETPLATITMTDFSPKEKVRYKIQQGLYDQLLHKVFRVRILGSAGCEFSCVATGKHQGYIMTNPNIWDLLPGLFLCEKAGCEVVRVEQDGECVVGAVANKQIKEEVEKIAKVALNKTTKCK